MSTARKVLALVSLMAWCGIELALAAGGTVAFGTPGKIAVGQNPEDVVAADFNNDTHIDLAVANKEDGTLSVLLNNGQALFSLAQLGTFTGTLPRPFAMVAGRFNEDDFLDLAVVLEGADQVALLMNNGDGTFDTPVLYAVGDSPRAIAAGDFGGGSGLDLIVANQQSSSVSVLLNNGDGTFAAALNVPVMLTGTSPPALPNGVTVGDFNKDSKLDFAVCDIARHVVTVRLGNGDGTFEPLASYAVAAGGEPWAILAADLDDDGKLDLATANKLGDNVSVLMGNGDGTFKAAVNYTAGNSPQDIIVVDLNGDGALDLVTANFEGNNVSVLLNKGDGTFDAPLNSKVGTGPVAVVTADLNGDGDLDVVTANETSDNVSILLGGAAAPANPFAQCAGAGATCGSLGLMPFALVLFGLVGMKRCVRWRR